MTHPMKLIIDTDPGIDDAMAIFFAAACPDIDLIGLTTVFGNVTTQIATRNALRLLEWSGVDCPVAEGAAVPRALPPFAPSAAVHGEQGFGDIPAETPERQKISESAAAFLTRLARENPGQITLCPIGPLTNIAAAIDLDPDFERNIKQIVIMGGSLDEGGNITPHAEANIYHDPHAADVVFASNANVTMVGLDVTHRILCTAADFTAMATASPRLGGLIQKMSEFYLHFYTTVGKHDGCSLHDPAAVIACIRPDLFTAQKIPINVSLSSDTSGATIRSSSARPSTNVLMKTDAAAVKSLFLKTMATLD